MPTIATLNITNISNQTVPILVNSISAANASSASTVPASKAQNMPIAPGVQVVIETSRVSLGQLEQLRRKNLISY